MPQANARAKMPRIPLHFPANTVILLTRGKWDTYTEAGVVVALKDLDQDLLVAEFRAELQEHNIKPTDEISEFVSWLVSKGYAGNVMYDVWYLGRRHDCFTYKHRSQPGPGPIIIKLVSWTMVKLSRWQRYRVQLQGLIKTLRSLFQPAPHEAAPDSGSEHT